MTGFAVGLGSYAFRWSIGHGDRVPPHPMTAIEVLEFGLDHGARVVQIADNMRAHLLTDAELDALAARARVGGAALEVGMQGFDRRLASRYAAVARRLDAGILRVALDAADARRDQGRLAAELRDAAHEAGEAGARIAVENHFGFPSTALVRLLEAAGDDRLGVCLDVGNSICAGEWPGETVRLLAPWTINLHLKDWTFRPDPYGVGFHVEGAPFGEGRTDAASVLAALDGRPPMSVIYEHWLPWQGDLEATRALERRWTSDGLAAFRSLLSA